MESVGIPFLLLEIPQGKLPKSIDVSETEHKAVYEDFPKAETQKLQELVDQLIIDNLSIKFRGVKNDRETELFISCRKDYSRAARGSSIKSLDYHRTRNRYNRIA